MTMIFLLSAISLVLAIGFLSAFIWAVKSGQFEDDYTPSVRILFEENKKQDTTKSNNKIENKNQKQ